MRVAEEASVVLQGENFYKVHQNVQLRSGQAASLPALEWVPWTNTSFGWSRLVLESLGLCLEEKRREGLIGCGLEH